MRSEDRYDKRGGGDQLIYGELADGEEQPIGATSAGELLVRSDFTAYELLGLILLELQVMNLHLGVITGEAIEAEDTNDT